MKAYFADEIAMEEDADSTAELHAAEIEGVVSAEFLELDAVKVTFENVNGGTFTEYFNGGEAEVALKYGQEVAEIVNEILWNS